jgi:predicted MPP superfamily phosphohydrolase
MSASPADLFEVDGSIAATGSPCAPAEARAAGAARGKKLTRRQLFGRILGTATFAAAGGAYGREVEPFWVEWHDRPMAVRGLPKSLEGFRITQLTDLHAGTNVPISYLRRVIGRVKDVKPDLVVVTGDLVNHALDWVVPICDALMEIPQKLGVPMLVTLGNHDYDISNAYAGVPTRIADTLEARLTSRNVPVLRNKSWALQRPDGRMWFVGLEDLWSGRFSPAVAFAGVPMRSGEPIIALSHNPDTALDLDTYGAQWILAGHTHGGQVRLPGYGALLLNVQNQEFQQGQFELPHGGHLYVARGVGYLKRVRMFCRPEVPTFVLHQG